MSATNPTEVDYGADLASLSGSLGECMLADRWRLRAKLRRLADVSKSGKTVDRDTVYRDMDRLRAAIEKACARPEMRRARKPPIEYPQELPVSQKRDEIARAIEENQVVIVCGETGSGKTTQLPKICLDIGRGILGQIGHTQPRRIAARAVANRVAKELRSPLGEVVGYQVRFTDRSNPDNLIKLMTDGILLAETQSDRKRW